MQFAFLKNNYNNIVISYVVITFGTVMIITIIEREKRYGKEIRYLLLSALQHMTQ